MIGQVENEARARLFSDFLYAKGIDNQVEPDRGGAWLLWVHDEEHLGRASTLLDQFRANPGDPKYLEASASAEARRESEADRNLAAQKRFYDRRKLFPKMAYGVGVLTAGLVAISLVVGVFSKLGADMNFLGPLLITDPASWVENLHEQNNLPELRQGQVWRVITPIFIHFSLAHLLFNMLWLLDLGTMIERRQSSRLLLALVLVIGATSNLAQYLVGGPFFGGMSGVVYGLIGYIWVRGKFDVTCGLFLHRTTVTMAMIWFFLCLADVIPQVANAAHAAGLGVGMAWGFISARGWKRMPG